MPCNSDYMEPTTKERALQHTAQLYVYVLEMMQENIPAGILAASQDNYCQMDVVALLCGTLKQLEKNDPALFDATVYDWQVSRSRQLAEWWSAHLLADAEREKEEQRKKECQQIAQTIKSRLSKKQIEFLKNHGAKYL